MVTADIEGRELIERKHRFGDFSVRSAENLADDEASVLTRESESNCERWGAEQIRRQAQALTRVEDSQLFHEVS
jgi:hypothetical protein